MYYYVFRRKKISRENSIRGAEKLKAFFQGWSWLPLNNRCSIAGWYNENAA
jgi:hypothetical protein